MSPATLTPPPVLEPSPPRAAPRPVRPVARAPLRRARGDYPGLKVSRGGLLASLAVHLLLGVLLVLGIDQVTRKRAAERASAPTEQVGYLDLAQFPTSVPGSGPASAPAPGSAAAAAQAATAAAIDAALARVPELRRFPTRTPSQLPPVPVPGSGAAVPTPAVPSTGTGTSGSNPNAIAGDAAGGRYGAGFGDRRLIVPPAAAPERVLTEHERYMQHLAQSLGQYNDSVAEEAEHQRRIRNWTVRDGKGREWGLGQGGVPVIAGHRIPVPLSPPIYQGRDREEAERTANRQHADINRQAEETDIARNFHERARETRRRNDEERQRRRAAAADSARKSSSSP